jgi:hypothetical protein
MKKSPRGRRSRIDRVASPDAIGCRRAAPRAKLQRLDYDAAFFFFEAFFFIMPSPLVALAPLAIQSFIAADSQA